jgi:tetratricopeptide (TPR) repeat protein
MNKRRTKVKQRSHIQQPAPTSVANLRRLVIIATMLLVILGLGAVVVERLTRPSGASVSALDRPQEASIAQREALIPPPRAEPTYVETAAEGKQLGKEIAEQFPDHPQALAIAGNLRFTFGDPDQARDDWQRTIELDPQSAAAWLGLAKTAHKLGDFERAVQCMQRLGEVAADQADSQVFFQVDSLLKLGRPQEVVDCLEKLGESASLPAGARVTLGEAYYQLQQYEQAADQYRQALDDPEQASVAHYGLSMALIRLGQHDEAQQHRQEYARLQEANMAHFDRMQGAGTDQERNDPRPLYPILASFHFEAAKLYAIRGQRDRAREHALRAWALAPDRPEPRFLLESL